jgi:hypothetical protein
MAFKRVVQAYKGAGQWHGAPPGIGDFVRGACHLFERLAGSGVEFRLDVSQSGFASLIEHDEAIFHRGDAAAIARAGEHFEDDRLFERDLAAFLASDDDLLYVSSNMGAWNRVALPGATRAFMRQFYRFTADIEQPLRAAVAVDEFEVLSIRCGDQFFEDPTAMVSEDMAEVVERVLQRHVLPHRRFPLVIISDSYALKMALAGRYDLIALDERSQHGAFGDARAVAKDLSLLKRSRFNYHINLWADWWSGFSHYTSRVFRIAEMNFRSPRMAKETVSATGRWTPWS